MNSREGHIPGCKCGRHWAVNPRCDCGQPGPDNIPGDRTRCSDGRGHVRRSGIPPCARRRQVQERALDVGARVHITVDGRAPLFGDSNLIVWNITAPPKKIMRAQIENGEAVGIWSGLVGMGS